MFCTGCQLAMNKKLVIYRTVLLMSLLRVEHDQSGIYNTFRRYIDCRENQLVFRERPVVHM